jgi:hypothetical protein
LGRFKSCDGTKSYPYICKQVSPIFLQLSVLRRKNWNFVTIHDSEVSIVRRFSVKFLTKFEKADTCLILKSF